MLPEFSYSLIIGRGVSAMQHAHPFPGRMFLKKYVTSHKTVLTGLSFIWDEDDDPPPHDLMSVLGQSPLQVDLNSHLLLAWSVMLPV